MKEKEAAGPLHRMPADMGEVISSTSELSSAWKDLTPLARNEWICWVTSAKKPETRKQRIERASKELVEGKRRPCCWPGCPHRNPKTKKYFK